MSRKVKSPCVVYVMDSLHLTNSMIKTPADGKKNSVSDPDWIRIQLGQWIRICIRKGKISHKNKKSYEILCFEVVDVLF